MTSPGPAIGPDAVVVLAHGGPSDLDDLPRFLASVIGRAPTDAVLGAAAARYRAIGGRSPMPATAVRIGRHLAASLGREVAVGFRHAEPSIEAAVAELVGRGARSPAAVCLVPHYSDLGPGDYLRRCGVAATAAGLPDGVATVADWSQAKGLIDYWSARVLNALPQTPSRRSAGGRQRPNDRQDCHVVFTAHSLPLDREPAHADYADRVAATARSVARRCRLDRARWSVAFQGADEGRGAWLEPTLESVLERLAGGDIGVVVAPVGYVCENVETLYDLDVDARRLAVRSGLGFHRLPTPDDSPALVRSLAAAVEAAAREVAGA